MTCNQSQRLYHYDIKGTHLGVPRASKTLSASKASANDKTKVAALLLTHKDKATDKHNTLEKKTVKLNKRSDKLTTNLDPRTTAFKKDNITKNNRLREMLSERVAGVDKILATTGKNYLGK